MLSYWEKQSLLHYDILIIGSGIVGLSTAASIKEKAPHLQVAVMERGILPTGASTKNAGFACIGSLTEILDDLTHLPANEVVDIVALRYHGLQKLRKRLGDDHIRYANNGSYELLGKEDEVALDQMESINQLLFPVLKAPAFSRADDQLRVFGFSPRYTSFLVSNNLEGELHTGELMRTLIMHCLRLGIEIKTGCAVAKIEEEKNHVNVVVFHEYLQEEITFTGRKVAVCTNAFTRQFFPDMEVQPGRGQVLITEPMPEVPFKGIFHFDKGYYYFRRMGNRVLFGGGRNLDKETERTTEFAFNEKIRADLLQKLQHMILPGIPFRVADWWTGIMAFGQTRQPIVSAYTDRLFVAARLGGMGVAIGSEVGENLALMMLDSQ